MTSYDIYTSMRTSAYLCGRVPVTAPGPELRNPSRHRVVPGKQQTTRRASTRRAHVTSLFPPLLIMLCAVYEILASDARAYVVWCMRITHEYYRTSILVLSITYPYKSSARNNNQSSRTQHVVVTELKIFQRFVRKVSLFQHFYVSFFFVSNKIRVSVCVTKKIQPTARGQPCLRLDV